VFNLTTQNPENMFTDYLNSNAPSNIYRGVWDAVNGTHYDQNYNTLPGGYVTAYTEQFDILSSGNLVQIVNNTLTYQSEVKTLAYNATSHDYDVLSTSTPSLPNQIKTLNATSSGAIIISEGAGFYKIENGVISVYSGDYQNGSFNSAVQTGTIPMSQGQAGPISYNDVETSILDADGNIILTDKSPFSYWTQTNLLQKYAERVAYRISPALPNGLQLDPANGEISGTPTVTSVATNYTITAYNSVGSRSTSLNITVGAPIDFTYQRNGNTGLANAPWSGSVTNPLFSGSNFASTGSQGVTLDISESTDRYGIYSPSGVTFSISPALPTGLSFNTSTGQITGTPTVARNLSTYTVTAVNAYGTSTATLQFAITGVATLSYGGNQTYIQGIVGSATPQVGGISGTITYTATGLPTGVTLSPSGTLLYDGQGAAVSATSVSITATGSTSGTATATFTVTILPPGSAPSNLVYGGPYSLSTAGSIPAITPSITAGTGSVTYSISPNLTSLTGLSINPSTGVISGTPNTAMLATTFTVTASSAYGSTSSTFSLALGAPPAAITYPASAYQFWQNEAISNIVVSGGSGASSFSATQLPAGLQIDPVSGTIYGLPTQVQSATLATVSATNSFGSATYGITFTVVAPPSISYTTPHDLIVSTAASISPSITGGLSNTITLSPSLPAGLSINAAGVISGTPSTTSVATTYTATLTSTVNGTTKTANASTVIRVGVGPSALTYSSPVLLRQNAGMSQLSPSITAGSGILTYTATGLPVGVLIDPATGILYGTPTTLQSASNATITATSTFGSTSTTVSLAVGAAPSALSYPASTYQFTNGASIGSLTPSITSGTGSTTYSISPSLPTGLVFNTTTGVISGTTNVVSNTIYTITASNSYGSTTYPLQITTGVAPAFTYVSPQVYTAGTSISALAPVLTAGTGNINYTISPALPTGLAIDPLNGTITGTPSTGIAVAASTYTVTATNAFGSGTANISIQVLGPPTNLSYGGNLAYPINIALSGSGSVPTISSNPAATFSINQALPAGLSFNTSTGAITGTPTVATAPTSYTVTATNGIAPDATVTFTIAVTAFPIISYTTPQNLPVGQAANIVVTAYNSPTSYSVSPALPTGLSLNTTSGLISGTPSSVQSLSTYTVTATNVFGSGTTTVDISIGNPPSAYSYSSNSLVLGTGSAMSALSATVTSGSSAVTYSVSPSLPAGLTLNTSTGVISGTPTSPVAQQSYTFTASNAFGSTTTTVSITTGTPPSNLLVSGSIVATAGASLSPVTPSVTAGTGTLTYSVGPALPTGLTLNTSTGVISGTPSTGIAVANTNYTLTATSAFGSTSTSFALQVQGPPSNLSYGGNMSFSVNAAISPQIPTVNANPSPSFSISPGLPAGLSFNTSTGAITGTPTSAQAATSYQVTANNGISPSATTTFTITILAAPVISYVQPTVYLVGTNITPLTPTVSGNVVTWSISPSSLPAGLSFNNSNGQITGNPTAVFASQNFTVTATNQHGSGTSMFQLAVHSIPTGLSYGGVVQAILGIPTNGSGFVPTLVASPSPTFSISPGLPPGLSFNTSTGAITGTATSLLSLSTFTVTATNSVGSASFPIQLQVVPNDTDGDGVTDAQELLDGTNPNDGCSYLTASQVLANTSPSWQNADCDGDGTANGTDPEPLNYCVGGSGQVPANGTPAYDIFRYLDCDNDGILNGLECTTGVTCPDFDNDGIPNYLDTDSDNDQIGDITEGNIDTDGDGSANYIDLDSDNDGILDIRETTQDRDGDGTPNYLDLDSDGDGILDTVEATADYRAVEDSNGDGICDRGGVTSDANYNGIPDQLEPAFGGRMLEVPDTDKDGTPDFLDLDADEDGILDSIELTGDMDADQHPNYRDGDSDGDGISDSVEKFGDMDGDGKPNFLDLDSDGDGLSDQYEGLNLCFDCGRVDNNDDGYDDRAQQDPKYPAVDTDKDGAPDFLDLDSDNDGIPDAVEAGNDPTNPVDTDQDGTPDFRDIDSDNDGIPDSIEAGKDPAVPVDTDNDGTPDFRDLDSDNDGITDAIEAGADPTKPLDTDGDGIYDFRDLDSDNDGISDNIEKGPTATPVDTDKDGLPDYRDIDSDNDGISDNIEKGPTATPVDTDGDSTPDFRDLDSDNDGISDNIEKGPTATPIDTDGDGIADFRDLDSDNDGISDNIEKGPTATPVDTDGDGLPDYRDLDSDNDGISDNIEKGPTTTPVDTDKDGNADFRDLDSDNDGITDKIEAGPDAKNPLDTDKDLTYDFRDIDSDNDGILDKDEDDLNMGAIPDCDQDGIPNRLDSDVCKGFAPNGISPNGDGKNDVLIIPGIMQVQPNRLSVFNRWGSLVFEKENYQNDWNGANLPDGTYYYIVDYFGKKVALKNYLYINRLGK
jgi:gliding motility-associated-like protein